MRVWRDQFWPELYPGTLARRLVALIRGKEFRLTVADVHRILKRLKTQNPWYTEADASLEQAKRAHAELEAHHAA